MISVARLMKMSKDKLVQCIQSTPPYLCSLGEQKSSGCSFVKVEVSIGCRSKHPENLRDFVIQGIQGL